ncbi:hypothetical protein PENTCL1PPCAC_5159, partial [Pristionchus entomophagus]
AHGVCHPLTAFLPQPKECGTCTDAKQSWDTIECAFGQVLYFDNIATSMNKVFCSGNDWKNGNDAVAATSTVYCGPPAAPTTTTASPTCGMLAADYPNGCTDCSSPTFSTTETYCC